MSLTHAILGGYPKADSFSKVTAVTNRPLRLQAAIWPESGKLRLVSGVDLLAGDQASLDEALRKAIPEINIVTHVYFTAYVHDRDPSRESEINSKMLRRAVTGVEALSKHLNFVLLITRTKAYGVHITDWFPFYSLLLEETQPRIPEPYASHLFYYKQIDLLQSLSRSKSWTLCNLTPDGIIGFIPNDNYNCLAQALARYLSLVRELEGPDATPGIIAKFAVHASLSPEISAGQSYNIADNSESSSWSSKWPIVCAYFGLKGVSPDPSPGPEPIKYLVEHAEEWEALEKKYGLRESKIGYARGSNLVSKGVLTYPDKDRPVDMSKTHRAWSVAKEECGVKDAYWTAFDRFRRAKIIP